MFEIIMSMVVKQFKNKKAKVLIVNVTDKSDLSKSRMLFRHKIVKYFRFFLLSTVF